LKCRWGPFNSLLVASRLWLEKKKIADKGGYGGLGEGGSRQGESKFHVMPKYTRNVFRVNSSIDGRGGGGGGTLPETQRGQTEGEAEERGSCFSRRGRGEGKVREPGWLAQRGGTRWEPGARGGRGNPGARGVVTVPSGAKTNTNAQ